MTRSRIRVIANNLLHRVPAERHALDCIRTLNPDGQDTNRTTDKNFSACTPGSVGARVSNRPGSHGPLDVMPIMLKIGLTAWIGLTPGTSLSWPDSSDGPHP